MSEFTNDLIKVRDDLKQALDLFHQSQLLVIESIPIMYKIKISPNADKTPTEEEDALFDEIKALVNQFQEGIANQ